MSFYALHTRHAKPVFALAQRYSDRDTNDVVHYYNSLESIHYWLSKNNNMAWSFVHNKNILGCIIAIEENERMQIKLWIASHDIIKQKLLDHIKSLHTHVKFYYDQWISEGDPSGLAQFIFPLNIPLLTSIDFIESYQHLPKIQHNPLHIMQIDDIPHLCEFLPTITCDTWQHYLPKSRVRYTFLAKLENQPTDWITAEFYYMLAMDTNTQLNVAKITDAEFHTLTDADLLWYTMDKLKALDIDVCVWYYAQFPNHTCHGFYNGCMLTHKL